MHELGIATSAISIGSGSATAAFRHLPEAKPPKVPYFIYTGSFSEWHGADVFLDAFMEFSRRRPGYRLIFVGNGSERDALESKSDAQDLPDVEFRDPIDPIELNELFAGTFASLASLEPGAGYHYAFTTKVYSSIATGRPVVFTGTGSTTEFVHDAKRARPIGVAVPYEVGAIAAAFIGTVDHLLVPRDRQDLGAWAREEYSLEASADTVVRIPVDFVSGNRP